MRLVPLPLPEDFSPEVQHVLDDANVLRQRLLRLTLALLMAAEVAAEQLAQQAAQRRPGYETVQVLQKQWEAQADLYREFYDRLVSSSP
jgi:hypothetical protein